LFHFSVVDAVVIVVVVADSFLLVLSLLTSFHHYGEISRILLCISNIQSKQLSQRFDTLQITTGKWVNQQIACFVPRHRQRVEFTMHPTSPRQHCWFRDERRWRSNTTRQLLPVAETRYELDRELQPRKRIGSKLHTVNTGRHDSSVVRIPDAIADSSLFLGRLAVSFRRKDCTKT
jgi:hypothetical protein